MNLRSSQNLLKFSLLLMLLLLINACNLVDDPIIPDPTISVNAGADQVVGLTELVMLSGTGSSSDGGAVTFLWEILSKPSASSFSLSMATENAISFTPDQLGEYNFSLTVSNQDGISESDDVLVSVEQIPTILSGRLTEDKVLENIYEDPSVPDYKVPSTYTISSQLTIQEDVRIIFEADAGLSVQSNGSLIAKGAIDKAIVFTGVQQTPGFWKGINILSNDPDNVIEYVTIEYGGSSGFAGPSKLSNITINDAGQLRMNNCISRESGGYGIYTNSEESKLVDFNKNSLTGNVAPVMTRIHHYGYFDSDTDYSGNTNNYIDSYRGDGHVTANSTWQALNVPYRLSNAIESIKSDITIMPGSSFTVQAGGGILVREEGSLSAEGEEGNTITFYGDEDVPGYWRGLSFLSNTTKNKLDYVEISNGGSQGFDASNIKSNIMVSDAGRLAMTNCVSSKSGEYGLTIRVETATLMPFSNNTFEDNITPVRAEVDHLHFFDSESDFSRNENDYVYVYGDPHTTTGTIHWKKLNVPYKFSDSEERLEADLTIDPGVEIIFEQDGGLQILELGSLNAIGNSDEPIIFRGEEDLKGFWKGIQIQSLSQNNIISYLSISGGGSGGFDAGGRKSNIEVVGNLELSFSSISKSSGYGIRVRRDAILTEFENTFMENDTGDIFYDE